MRVILDANILIRYLLTSRQRQSAVLQIVDAALARLYVLLLPTDLLREVTDGVTNKPRLASRIALQDARAFVDLLREVAEPLRPHVAADKPISRDPKDDYLYLAAQQSSADYLVTSDKDLLVLAADAAPVRIVTPTEFLQVLRVAGLV